MDFSTSFKICSSGLAAQRRKMDIIATNLANVDTTRTAEGGPYKRQVVVLDSEPVAESFGDSYTEALKRVAVSGVVRDETAGKKIYDPGHPEANKQGFVEMPNVNTAVEMADMIMTNRAYEACVTAFDATKNMALKALELGK